MLETGKFILEKTLNCLASKLQFLFNLNFQIVKPLTTKQIQKTYI